MSTNATTSPYVAVYNCLVQPFSLSTEPLPGAQIIGIHNNITGDPEFTDTALNDFRLKCYNALSKTNHVHLQIDHTKKDLN